MVVDSMAVTTSEIQSADGVQILAGAVVQPRVNIGGDNIINTGARIDHDCEIGAGASLIPDITIGENSVIGSGSVIVSDALSSARVAQKRITISL